MVHAIALMLSLSLALAPEPATPAAPVDTAAEPGSVEPEQPDSAEPELPDVAPVEPEAEAETEPEIGPAPEPTPEVEPTPEPPPPADDQALAASVDEEPPVRDRLGCNGSKSCRKMSIAGIVVGSLGLAAVGVGIGLLVRPDEVLVDQPIFVKSTHPAGLVAVTIGAGVALTSALMLGAAHKGYKQGSGKSARVQVGPTGLRF